MDTFFSNPVALVTFIYPAVCQYLPSLVSYINKQSISQFSVIIFNDGVASPDAWFQSLRLPFEIIPVQSSTPMAIRFEALTRLKKMPFEKLIFQDSDDGISENRIAVVTKWLNQYVLVVNDLDLINQSGTVTDKKIWDTQFKSTNEFTFQDLNDSNFAGLGNTGINKRMLMHLPKMPREQIVAVDWYLFYAMLKQSNATGYRTSTCTTLYRQHEGNTIGRMNTEKTNFALKVKCLHYTALHEAGLIDQIPMKKEKTNTPHKSEYQHPFWWEITH